MKQAINSSLYICHTPYHVLIACQKALVGRQLSEEKMGIVLVDSIPSVSEYVRRLKSTNLFNEVYEIRHNAIFASWTNTSFYKSLLFLKMNKNVNNRLNFIDKYSEVYIFNDHRDVGAYLHHSKKAYHLLEDGKDCFKLYDQNNLPTANSPTLRKILKRVFNIPIGMGDSKYCIDVEVNSTVNLKTELKKPLILMPKKELGSNLDKEELAILRQIFPIPTIDTSAHPCVLVLTSPPEAHGRKWSEFDHFQYYKKILDSYDGWTKFLKPHPRDYINYIPLLDSCTLIESEIPIEAIDLLTDVSFDRCVCYMSTALTSLSCCYEKKILKSNID